MVILAEPRHAVAPSAEDLSLVSPARLGGLLLEARRQRGWSIQRLATETGQRFDVAALQALESGERSLTESELVFLASVYGIPTGRLLPARMRLVIDPTERLIQSGDASTRLRWWEPWSDDRVLDRYLDMIYALRGVSAGPIPLRHADLATLAEALGLSVFGVDRKLNNLMRRRGRMAGRRLEARVVIPATGVFLACTAVGALVFEPDRDSSLAAAPATTAFDRPTTTIIDAPEDSSTTSALASEGPVLERRRPGAPSIRSSSTTTTDLPVEGSGVSVPVSSAATALDAPSSTANTAGPSTSTSTESSLAAPTSGSPTSGSPTSGVTATTTAASTTTTTTQDRVSAGSSTLSAASVPSAQSATTRQTTTTAKTSTTAASPTIVPTTAAPTTAAPTTTTSTTAPTTTAPPTTAAPTTTTTVATTTTAAPTTTAPTTTAAPTTTTAALARHEAVGQEALARISYPWQSLLPGWRIQFLPARNGYLGGTMWQSKTIEIYIRSSHSTSDVAVTLAHELGHAVDIEFNSDLDRERWRAIRGIDASAPWWGRSGESDYATPSGDFAEAFAAWQVGASDFRSRLAGPPDAKEKQLLSELSRS